METIEFITPMWISKKLTEFKLHSSNLAGALFIKDSYVKDWLSMKKPISDSEKHSLYYYFSKLKINKLRDRDDVLKLSQHQYLPIYLPRLDKYFSIFWSAFEPYLIVASDTPKIPEIQYLRITNHNYLLLDPEFEDYSILYELKIENDFSLKRKGQAGPLNEFEVLYS